LQTLQVETDVTDRRIFRQGPSVLVLGTAMTGKEKLMKWEQIETKWAAMTRRIRADYAVDRIEPEGRSLRGRPVRNTLSATIADSIAATITETERKSSAK
jgi:hypothetical protein